VPVESGGLQTQRGEPIEDTAEVFSRYLDGVMIRARSHKTLEVMAEKGRIPVINGLSDLFHPCQALADYMTIKQYGIKFDSNLSIAFIGEGNNVFNSLALGASFTGAQIRIASPEGYEVSSEMVSLLAKKGVDLQVFRDPYEAVEGAQVIYTDVWISMGQEDEAEERRENFAPYSITKDLLKKAASDHIVMHCLPAHRGEEISSEVITEFHHSIFDQAENRLHVQKAVLEWVFHQL
jgi:ornithine carbamoyltransferase